MNADQIKADGLPTDDEIERLALEHVSPGWRKLWGDRADYKDTELFQRVRNFAHALKAQPAPTEARPLHEEIVREGDALVCTACGTTSALSNSPEIEGIAVQGKDSARLDAARDVLAERQRQVESEGWTPAHDDAYKSLELSRAAASYISFGANEPPSIWPWARQWWKPDTYRRNLVKAGALIIAEIERVDRARASAETGEVKS